MIKDLIGTLLGMLLATILMSIYAIRKDKRNEQKKKTK